MDISIRQCVLCLALPGGWLVGGLDVLDPRPSRECSDYEAGNRPVICPLVEMTHYQLFVGTSGSSYG